MRLIVGLGNPGIRYTGTRHNVGFETIKVLAKRHGISVKSRVCMAVVGRGKISNQEVLLAKPMTFVNLSGLAVSQLIQRFNLELTDVLVICDDINLDLGRIRVRARGSAGGHKGLESIIERVGSQNFARIRIGIGTGEQNLVEHVLGKFQPSERKMAELMIDKAADAVEVILSEGIDVAMNKFNSAPRKV